MPEGQIQTEIFDTPAAIRATVDGTRKAAAEAAEAMRARTAQGAGGRIYLIGNGTSLYSSQAAAYTARAGSARRPVGHSGRRMILLLARPERWMVVASPLREFLMCGDFEVGGKACELASRTSRDRPSRAVRRAAFSAGGNHVPVMTKTYASTLTAAHLLLLSSSGTTGMVRRSAGQPTVPKKHCEAEDV
jgi:hypothetical protein